MNTTEALMCRCREFGATFSMNGDRIKIEAPQPLPDNLIYQLKHNKSEIISTIKNNLKKEQVNWLLEKWREISIPEWRRILKESIESNDIGREKYARWMLTEMLDDPEYEENGR